MDTSGEEKNKTFQEKLWTWLYRGREEGGGLDGDGSEQPGTYKMHMKWQLTRLKTDSTGTWCWRQAHKDVEMVCKGEKREKGDIKTNLAMRIPVLCIFVSHIVLLICFQKWRGPSHNQYISIMKSCNIGHVYTSRLLEHFRKNNRRIMKAIKAVNVSKPI